MCRGLEEGTLKPRLIAGDGVLASLRPLTQTFWSQIKQVAGWAALDNWLSGKPGVLHLGRCPSPPLHRSPQRAGPV